MTKRFWLGALAYLVLTFPLAFVWHLVLLKETYDRLGIFNRDEPIVALGFTAIVLQCLLLSFAYSRFYRGGAPVWQGLKFGAFAGAFLWSSQVLAAAAKHEVSSLSTWLALETGYFAIQFALVGIGIGLAYGRGSEERAPR